MSSASLAGADRDQGAPEDRRWPRSVYAEGTEPDYRFSLANERTYLAWIRTALALLAAAVVLDIVELSLSSGVQTAVAACLVLGALGCAVTGWFRWAGAERAMRRRETLPAFGLAAVVSAGMIGLVLVVVADLLIRRLT